MVREENFKEFPHRDFRKPAQWFPGACLGSLENRNAREEEKMLNSKI